MAIDIDDEKFRQVLGAAAGNEPLDPGEIPAIIRIVELAAAVDLDDDRKERSVARALTRRLCALGGLAPDAIAPLSPVPTDDEDRAAAIAAIAGRLTTQGGRDLGFAVAYLVIVADLELAPIEAALLDHLQRALGVPRDRADALAAVVSAIVTPDAHAAAPALAAQTP